MEGGWAREGMVLFYSETLLGRHVKGRLLHMIHPTTFRASLDALKTWISR